MNVARCQKRTSCFFSSPFFGNYAKSELTDSITRLIALLLFFFLPSLAYGQSQFQYGDPTPQEILIAEERYVLAFVGRISGQNSIFVSLSKDGRQWTNTNFPIATEMSFPENGGVGACGSYNGKNITVIWNNGGFISILEGILSADAVSWSEDVKRIAVFGADSAPSCVYLDKDVRIVAIRSGGTVVAHTFMGQDEFLSQAVPDLFNRHSIGRPAIAAARGNAVMAWHQGRDVCSQIVLAQGRIVENPPLAGFKFEKTGFLPLSDNDVSPCALSEPVISTDGRRYFVLVLQKAKLPPNTQSDDRLSGYRAILYASDTLDLYSGWYELDRTLSGPNPSSNMGLASAQTGSSVFALIRKERNHNEAVAMILSDGHWSTLPDAVWLGIESFPYTKFGLARIGVHAPRVLPESGDFVRELLPRLRVPQQP